MSEPRRGRLLMIEVAGRGGVADYARALSGELAALGWEVRLATATDHMYDPIPGVEIVGVFRYLRDERPLERALRRRGLGKPVNGLRFLLSMPRLMLLARRAEIVHTQGWEIPQLGLVAMICLRLTGRPVVQTSHQTFERADRFLRTRRAVRELTATLAARTIVHTRADAARVPAAATGSTAVIPHGEYGGLARGGGGAERAGSRERLGIAQGAPVVLLFGQLRPDKGLGDLIYALRELGELHLLVGGQEAGALAEQAAALREPGLAERIVVREGYLEMSQAAELFAAADTVALPYRVASQSGVLLLAYGFHRPVIVYPVGGLEEAVIDGETGWICSAPDERALVRALQASIEAGPEECLRRGEAGARLADERYSWASIARRTDELYREVLADG